VADSRWSLRVTGRRVAVVGLALVLVAGLVVVGAVIWKRTHRTDLEEALGLVPASSLRVGFTDWGVVRKRLKAHLGDTPDPKAIEGLMQKAYDTDYAAASSIDESAAALQKNFGFSPATAQWEAFAQGKQGATMVLKVAEGADFDVLAGNLRSAGYKKPKQDNGVWQGGVDVVANLDPTISPELQYVVLLADRGLVVSSDTAEYAASAAKVASGDASSFAGVDGVSDLAGRVGDSANAMLWGKDFACTDLAMSRADLAAQNDADKLVQTAGGVTPLAGLAMAMLPDRTLRVAAHFEDSERAEKNLRPRARLAVGEAVGRGGSFSDDFTLTSSKAKGSDVVLDLRPKTKTGYVLSALYDGPVLFATC
jgi:hypothetical protein